MSDNTVINISLTAPALLKLLGDEPELMLKLQTLATHQVADIMTKKISSRIEAAFHGRIAGLINEEVKKVAWNKPPDLKDDIKKLILDYVDQSVTAKVLNITQEQVDSRLATAVAMRKASLDEPIKVAMKTVDEYIVKRVDEEIAKRIAAMAALAGK